MPIEATRKHRKFHIDVEQQKVIITDPTTRKPLELTIIEQYAEPICINYSNNPDEARFVSSIAPVQSDSFDYFIECNEHDLDVVSNKHPFG